MKLEELTLDLIKQAYKETDSTPGSYFGDARWNMFICPLEAVARFKNLGRWANVLDDGQETSEFSAGWDNVNYDAISTPAYKLGKEVRAALLPIK